MKLKRKFLWKCLITVLVVIFLPLSHSNFVSASYSSNISIVKETNNTKKFDAIETLQQNIESLNKMHSNLKTKQAILYNAIVKLAQLQNQALSRKSSFFLQGKCACGAEEAAVESARTAVNIAAANVIDANKVSNAAKVAVVTATALAVAALAAVAACLFLTFPPFVAACEALTIPKVAILVAAAAAADTALYMAGKQLANAQKELDDAQNNFNSAITALRDCQASIVTCQPPMICSNGQCVSTQGSGALTPEEAPPGATIIALTTSGGMFSTPDQNVTISIPPNNEPETVNLVYFQQPTVPVTGFVPLKFFVLESYIQVGCQWQKYSNLNEKINLQVSYSPEQVVGLDESRLGLYYFDNGLAQWIPLKSKTNLSNDTVIAEDLDYLTTRGTLYALMAPAKVAAR